MRESHERVQERAKAKVQQTETAKLTLSEQLGRWRACSAETRLEEAFERLQVRDALGCPQTVSQSFGGPLIAPGRLGLRRDVRLAAAERARRANGRGSGREDRARGGAPGHGASAWQQLARLRADAAVQGRGRARGDAPSARGVAPGDHPGTHARVRGRDPRRDYRPQGAAARGAAGIATDDAADDATDDGQHP